MEKEKEKEELFENSTVTSAIQTSKDRVLHSFDSIILAPWP